jgi:hypothetical protein
MKRTDVVSVRGLLSGGARYRPVSAHRGYVWTPTDVAQLLVDLELAARDDELDEDDSAPDARFYLGVMTVNRERHGKYVVIDGQQRLITLAMLLAFCRDRIRDPRERLRLDRMLVRRSMSHAPEPRIRLAPEDHAWFSHFILPPGATARLPARPPIGSPRALLLAARFMEQAFLSYDQEDLLRMADYITLHAAVVRAITDPRDPRNTWVPQLPAPQRPQLSHSSHYGIAAE